MTASLKNWDGKSWDELPGMVIKNGGSAQAVLGLKQHIVAAQTSEAALTKDKIANLQSQNDAILEAHGAIESARKAPGATPQSVQAAYTAQLGNLAKVPGLDMSKIPQQYPGDQAFDAAGAGLTGTSARLQALARMKAAEKESPGQQPLGNVDQMNQALTSRFQVLNPGKPLPPQFTLPADATQKDYDRIDKALEATEKATGTKAQQDSAKAARDAAATLAKQNQQDREDKEGMQPVTGTDPKSGREVLVSASDAKKMGVSNPMKADADMVNKATAARHWMPLAEKNAQPELSDPNNPNSIAKNADQMGILQLIDRLDKRGELGTIASRWNDFMAGKVGAGDSEFQALRAKMKLSTTKLMQAHVGSRGGAFMLEHFEDIANTGKMDASTLRQGVLSELDYMRDVAMSPDKAGATPSKASGNHPFFSQFGGTVR